MELGREPEKKKNYKKVKMKGGLGWKRGLRHELTHLVMGTIFLVSLASHASEHGKVIVVCVCVCVCVCTKKLEI